MRGYNEAETLKDKWNMIHKCDVTRKLRKKVINNIEEKFGLDDLNNKFTSVSPLPERDLNLNSLATKAEF